jgi:hypothetical protein
MNLTDKQYKFIAFLAFAISTVLFISIAFKSFGYDDEYWNIRMIEENTLGILISKIQSSDVHPPLSYILNFVLFKVFNNWMIVRVFSAILFLIALGYKVSKTKNQEIKIILILLLGFNPTIMLWVTSIRWYAYAIPLLMIISIPLEKNNKYYWYYFFFGFLTLSFLSYIGMILIIPYFIWYYLQQEGSFVNRVRRIIIPGLLYLIFYSYQLYIFYTIHRFNNIEDNQQTFDLITSFKSYISSVFTNQAIFPISIVGIISIFGYLIISIVLITTLKNRKNIKILSLFLISSILYLITGIAGKLRNLVLLDISKAHLIGNSIFSKYKKWLYVGLMIIFIPNVCGIYNVWSHQRTTKNAWNLPLAKSIELMNRLEKESSKEVYFTFHPTYTYHLTKQNKDLISFYTPYYFDSTKIKTTIDKLINEKNNKINFNFILTYRGRSIEEGHYKEMITQMKALKADSIKIYQLGFDSDYKLKQKIYPDYPEYTFYLYKYYGVKSNILGLKVWERNKL